MLQLVTSILNSLLCVAFIYMFDEINYSLILVWGCCLDLSTEKLQMFSARLNPDR